MTNERDFLDRIVAEPENLDVRLAYADWLEERGDERSLLRAEFIRVQIELSRFEAEVEARPISKVAKQGGLKVVSRKIRDLRKRQDELLGNIENDPSDYGNRIWRWTGFDATIGHTMTQSGLGWEFRCGFVEEVKCGWTFWVEHHEAIRKATPLREVTLSTEPDVMIQEGQIVPDSSDRIPLVIATLVMRHSVEQDVRFYPGSGGNAKEATEKALKSVWPTLKFNAAWPQHIEPIPARSDAADAMALALEGMRESLAGHLALPPSLIGAEGTSYAELAALERQFLHGDGSRVPRGVIDARRRGRLPLIDTGRLRPSIPVSPPRRPRGRGR